MLLLKCIEQEYVFDVMDWTDNISDKFLRVHGMKHIDLTLIEYLKYC